MRHCELYRPEEIGPPKEESESAEIWFGMHVPAVLGHQEEDNLKRSGGQRQTESGLFFDRMN